MEDGSAETSAAKRRRQRRLRSWWRHECQSVRMALNAAVHHSAVKVAAGEKNSGLRAQTTFSAGRPGVLKDPAPQGAVTVGYVAAPGPLLVVASLAGGDGVDATTVSYLLSVALAKKKEEEEKEKEKEEKERMRKEVLAHAQERVRDGLPLSSAGGAAWRQWSGLPPRQEKRRKRKKRKKRRLPRTSSRPSRCRKLWRFRSCSFSTLSSSSPVVPQRQILMVQTILQITEFSQLLYVSGGRCPCCAGRACLDGTGMYMAGFPGHAAPRAVFLCFRLAPDVSHHGRYAPRCGWFYWWRCPSCCAPVYCRQAQDARHHGRYDSRSTEILVSLGDDVICFRVQLFGSTVDAYFC